MPWWRFLRRLYEQPGVKRDFDFVALHPYAPGLRLMRRQIELARRIMATADDSRTPLAITEVGWASEGRRRRWSRAPRAGTAAQAHLPPARRRPSGLADLGRAVVRLARFDGGRGVLQLLPARGPLRPRRPAEARLARLPAGSSRALARHADDAGASLAAEACPARDRPARVEAAEESAAGNVKRLPCSGACVEARTRSAPGLARSSLTRPACAQAPRLPLMLPVNLRFSAS